MRKQIFLTAIVFCLIGLAVFLPSESAHACELDPVSTTNWWFIQSYEFDPADLPEGVNIEAVYDYDPVLGELRFDVNRAGSVRIVGIFDPDLQDELLFEGREVTENFLNTRTRLVGLSNENDRRLSILYSGDMTTLFRNNDRPFMTDRPIPEPHILHLLITQDAVIQEIPMTVTYSANPNYQLNMLTNRSPFEDFVRGADAIVSGIALSPEHQPENGRIYGDATIRAGGWFKGSGRDQIIVGPFGDSASCLEELPVDVPLIFFLERSGENYRLLRTTSYDYSPRPYGSFNVNQLVAATGHEVAPTDYTETFQEIVLALENGEPFPQERVNLNEINGVWWFIIGLGLMLIILYARRRSNN